jgi:predicted enzyme related to lactoylglutathione lyase
MRKLAAILGALGLAGCVSLDPQGAAPIQDTPAAKRPRMERHVDASLLPRVYSVRVRTSDLERASRFYRDLFDGRVSQVFPGENAVHLASGVYVVLNQSSEGAPATADATAGFIVQVADLDATLARVAAAGGVVVRAPNDHAPAFQTRSASIRDPDGVEIELIQFAPRAP